MLFEVVILENPKAKDKENGELERLILGPVMVVAVDEQSAAISAVMDNKDMKMDKNRMQVLVRPFG